jgi:triosephosphate isomerase
MAASRMRTPLVAGNWKMHKTVPEARLLAAGILEALDRPEARWGSLQVGLFPAAVCLAEVASLVRGAPAASRVLVGAQNIHFASKGAFTGEISAEMVLSAGGEAVILGHSERRHIFHESDQDVGKKVRRALEAGLIAILCVGEKLEERDTGRTAEVVRRQLAAGIAEVREPAALERLVIAYEPVWAIGTGRNATPEQAQEVQALLRGELGRAFAERGGEPSRGTALRIIYGGSVNPENAAGLMRQPDIDGALVGGASLEVESFLGICRAALL